MNPSKASGSTNNESVENRNRPMVINFVEPDCATISRSTIKLLQKVRNVEADNAMQANQFQSEMEALFSESNLPDKKPEKVIEPEKVVEPENDVEPEEVAEPEKVVGPEEIVESEKVVEPEAVAEPEKVVRVKRIVNENLYGGAEVIGPPHPDQFSVREVRLHMGDNILEKCHMYLLERRTEELRRELYGIQNEHRQGEKKPDPKEEFNKFLYFFAVFEYYKEKDLVNDDELTEEERIQKEIEWNERTRLLEEMGSELFPDGVTPDVLERLKHENS